MKPGSTSSIPNFQFSIAFFLVFAFASYLVPCTFVLAQAIPVSISGIELTPSSSSPVPGQSLTITAASYSADINSAKITWTVNGKATQSGTGDTALTIQAPAIGKKLTVVATAATVDGRQLTDSIDISSGSVDMILETDGYTPPMFLGKISPVYENTVTVVAMPHLANSSGVEFNPATFVYKWKKDNAVLESQSGYGKQSLTVAPGNLISRPYLITVDVTSGDGSVQGEGNVQVNPQATPDMAFYVDDPLFGPLYNRAVGSTLRIGSQKEASILAVPYGFNGASSDGSKISPTNLTLNWTVNGGSHPELASSKSIVLRAPAGAAGSSDIGLRVNGVNNILQSAELGFSVLFAANTIGSSTSQVTF